MRISEYPPEEMQEWLDNPMTRGFEEELDALIQSLRDQYFTLRELTEIYRHQGKELGVGEVKMLINSLREGL